jgi:hypothetical protein
MCRQRRVFLLLADCPVPVDVPEGFALDGITQSYTTLRLDGTQRVRAIVSQYSAALRGLIAGDNAFYQEWKAEAAE